MRISSMPMAMSACGLDRKSTRLNSSHTVISYAVFCLKKKKSLHIVWHRLCRNSDEPYVKSILVGTRRGRQERLRMLRVASCRREHGTHNHRLLPIVVY